MRHIKSAVGKTIQSFTESADAYTFGLSDGTTARVPKGPLQDCRELIDKWVMLWPRHMNSLVPPAHQGWGIIDFEEDAPVTECSGQLKGRGVFHIPKEFIKIRVTARAGLNRSANPNGLRYLVMASGDVQVTRGEARVVAVTSDQQEITLTGDPGTVATINSQLTFTYQVGSGPQQEATIPLVGYASVPSSVGAGTTPPVNLYGTLLLPDGSLVNGLRRTALGTITTNDTSALVPSRVTVGTDQHVWLAGTDETHVFEVGAEGSTVSYDMGPGVVAEYNYCDFPRPAHQPRGTVIREFCSEEPGNHDRMREVADGQGGTYQEVKVKNDPTCGYVPPVGGECQLSQQQVQVALEQGVAVNNQPLVSFSGFNTTPTVQLTSGTLPANLVVQVLGMNVVLSGTPANPGNINAVFTVSGGGCQKQFSVAGVISQGSSGTATVDAMLNGRSAGSTLQAPATSSLPLQITGQNFPRSTPYTVELQYTGSGIDTRSFSAVTTSDGKITFSQNVPASPNQQGVGSNVALNVTVKWTESGLPRQLSAGFFSIDLQGYSGGGQGPAPGGPKVSMNVNGQPAGSTIELEDTSAERLTGGFTVTGLPANAQVGAELYITGGGQNFHQDFNGWGGAQPSHNRASPQGTWSGSLGSWGVYNTAPGDGTVTHRYRFYYLRQQTGAPSQKVYLQDQIFKFNVTRTVNPQVTMTVNGYSSGSTQSVNHPSGTERINGNFSITGLPPNARVGAEMRISGGGQSHRLDFGGWGGAQPSNSQASASGTWSGSINGSWGVLHRAFTGSSGTVVTHTYKFYYYQGSQKVYLPDQTFGFRIQVSYNPSISMNVNGYGNGSLQNQTLTGEGYGASNLGGSFTITGLPPNARMGASMRITGGNQNFYQDFGQWGGASPSATNASYSGTWSGSLGSWGVVSTPQHTKPVTITHTYQFYYTDENGYRQNLPEQTFRFYCT